MSWIRVTSSWANGDLMELFLNDAITCLQLKGGLGITKGTSRGKICSQLALAKSLHAEPAFIHSSAALILEITAFTVDSSGVTLACTMSRISACLRSVRVQLVMAWLYSSRLVNMGFPWGRGSAGGRGVVGCGRGAL